MGENVEATLVYRTSEKFIVSVPIYGFDSTSKNIIDLTKIHVYGSDGKDLPSIQANGIALYYVVRDKQFPDNYRIYIKYNGKEYIMLDMNKQVAVRQP